MRSCWSAARELQRIAAAEPAVILYVSRQEMQRLLDARIYHSARTHTPGATPGRWPRGAYMATEGRELPRALYALDWTHVTVDVHGQQWIVRPVRPPKGARRRHG
jgi:hypothetical protein